jgi:flagellar basal-body rod modification protein FlgD
VTGTDTFLKLLVAQLQNQDPMSPMDDQSFVTELAQFNTVEQMLGVKQSIDDELGAQQASEGVAMLGKTITYSVPGIGGNPATVSQGVVSGVSLAGGQVQLQVGTQNVPLSGVTAVSS